MMKDVSLWALLPPLYSLFTAAGLWLVYAVAVDNKSVTPLSSHTWSWNGSLYPPYISVAGNFPPASCVFGQVMNVAACGGLLIGLFRFLQLRPRLDLVWLNRCSLATFCSACCGMSLLGNFQLFPQAFLHNLGALLTFGLGTLSCWLQWWLSVLEDGRLCGRAAVRFLLSSSITLSLFLYFFFMALAQHMHAARCQWALVSFLLLFISTFGLDFRTCSFYVVGVDAAARPITGKYESQRQDVSQAPPGRSTSPAHLRLRAHPPAEAQHTCA